MDSVFVSVKVREMVMTGKSPHSFLWPATQRAFFPGSSFGRPPGKDVSRDHFVTPLKGPGQDIVSPPELVSCSHFEPRSFDMMKFQVYL